MDIPVNAPSYVIKIKAIYHSNACDKNYSSLHYRLPSRIAHMILMLFKGLVLEIRKSSYKIHIYIEHVRRGKS